LWDGRERKPSGARIFCEERIFLMILESLQGESTTREGLFVEELSKKTIRTRVKRVATKNGGTKTMKTEKKKKKAKKKEKKEKKEKITKMKESGADEVAAWKKLFEGGTVRKTCVRSCP